MNVGASVFDIRSMVCMTNSTRALSLIDVRCICSCSVSKGSEVFWGAEGEGGVEQFARTLKYETMHFLSGPCTQQVTHASALARCDDLKNKVDENGYVRHCFAVGQSPVAECLSD